MKKGKHFLYYQIREWIDEIGIDVSLKKPTVGQGLDISSKKPPLMRVLREVLILKTFIL